MKTPKKPVKLTKKQIAAREQTKLDKFRFELKLFRAFKKQQKKLNPNLKDSDFKRQGPSELAKQFRQARDAVLKLAHQQQVLAGIKKKYDAYIRNAALSGKSTKHIIKLVQAKEKALNTYVLKFFLHNNLSDINQGLDFLGYRQTEWNRYIR